MARYTALAQRKKWLKILAIQDHEEVDEDPGYTAVCCRQYSIRPIYGNGGMQGNHQVGI
jgi:hypothetical protein